MSNLVVLGFDGIHTADDVLNRLRSLKKEYLIDLEDACVVEREKTGKVYIKQAVNLTALGAVAGGSRGALWGAIVGLLFLNPLAGMAIGAITGAGTGAGAGAITVSLAEYGIAPMISSKSSAKPFRTNLPRFFILFREVNEDKVLPEIQSYKPRVLRTSPSNEAEEKLKGALKRAA